MISDYQIALRMSSEFDGQVRRRVYKAPILGAVIAEKQGIDSAETSFAKREDVALLF
jgi:hypothetical protein